MQNYKESLGYRYFVGSGSVLTNPSKTTVDLVPLQIGLFDPKKGYSALEVGKSAREAREVVIAYGSPHNSPLDWVNSNVNQKVTVRADKLISYRKSLPKRPKNHIVAIGYDGVDATKTIKTKYDSTYSLFLQIEGSPASRFYGGIPLQETFVYSTPCYKIECGEEVTSCDIPEYNSEKVVDYFVDTINNHKYFKDFVKASKVINYDVTPSAAPTARWFDTYQITLCDEGTAASIARLAGQYNTEVTKVKREGSKSTYEITLPRTSGAPADFSTGTITTIPNCTTCPTGYTLVDSQYQYKVEFGSSGLLSDLDTIVETIEALEDVEKVVVIKSDVNGVTLFVYGSDELDLSEIVIEDTSGEDPVTIETIAAQSTFLGLTAAYCELDTAVDIPWVKVNEGYKKVANLSLTMGVEECLTPAETLAEMIAYYAGNSKLVANSIAIDTDEDCAVKFEAQILSDDLVYSDCGDTTVRFSTLDPYKGFIWKLEDPVSDTPDTNIKNIGIRLESAYVDTQYGECTWKLKDHVELDIPKIIVRQGEGYDLLGKCEESWAVTQLQTPEYASGIGANVQKDLIEASRFLLTKFDDSRRIRERLGYDFEFINRNGYYKFYYLTFEMVNKYEKYTLKGSDQRTTITFAFPEEADTTQFEALLEGWITSARPDLIDGVDLYNSYR